MSGEVAAYALHYGRSGERKEDDEGGGGYLDTPEALDRPVPVNGGAGNGMSEPAPA